MAGCRLFDRRINRSIGRVTLGAMSALALSVAVIVPASAATATPPSSAVAAKVFSPSINSVGAVNLTNVAAGDRAQSAAEAAAGGVSASAPHYHSVDDTLLAHAPHGASAPQPAASSTPLSNANVAGERGFTGLTAVQQASTPGGTDLEPPDQGLCAGNGYVMEVVNNALAIYDKSGSQVLSPISSPQVFLQPTTDFFSDPRCYFDASTNRWFIAEFIVGTTGAKGQETSPSVQFLAVSDTPDPTSGYHVYSFDTTDPTTHGCPCFGDYDQLGADANGIYITTDEFGVSTTAYNGSIVYALSKALVETTPASGISATVFGYRLTADPFGQPYLVAPTSTPAGAKDAPDTEYFVESNGNATSDHHLVVYALSGTSSLGAPAAPTLLRTEVASEGYSSPPAATQAPGPRPLGHAYQAPEARIQADFDSEMEPTYVDGTVHAQLDTATSAGTDGVDWFSLAPTISGTTLAAPVIRQGLVAVHGANLLYPYTALDSSGNGYLLFSLSGTSNYPSPAYISYGKTGPTGPVRIAYPGAAPEDGFTCYSAFVGPNYGGCRWGDYSMGVSMGGRIYMATEFIPPTARDLLTNWGTFIWSAPPQG